MIPEILTYSFMQKAFIVGIIVSIPCSLLGVFLVLRKYALIGDGLAHISFGGIATGLLFNISPFISALLFSIVGSIGILEIKKRSRIGSDSAIGIISHATLGIGIFIISLTNGSNIDLLSYLFGSILAIKNIEILSSVLIACFVLFFIAILYHDMVALTFDEDLAKIEGIKTDIINKIIIVLTAITIVSSMKVIGLLLASTLLIIPASSALQFKLSFKKTLLLSTIFSTSSVIVGITISYYYNFAPSGSIVLINTIVFLLSVLYQKIKVFN